MIALQWLLLTNGAGFVVDLMIGFIAAPAKLIADSLDMPADKNQGRYTSTGGRKTNPSGVK